MESYNPGQNYLIRPVLRFNVKQLGDSNNIESGKEELNLLELFEDSWHFVASCFGYFLVINKNR